MKDIEKGNQSGKEGDLSEIYRLVKQITEEMHEYQEAKTDAKAKDVLDQEQLSKAETLVLNGTKKRANENTAVRIKHADGSITVDDDREEKKKKQNNSIDSHVGELVKLEKMRLEMAIASTSTTTKECQEETVDRSMRMYCDRNGIDLDRFLLEAFRGTGKDPPEEVFADVRAVGGLETLISLYCARGCNFELANFKAEMKDVEINMKHAIVLYNYLQTLRRSSEGFTFQNTPWSSFSNPSTAATISSKSYMTQESDYGPPLQTTLLDDMVGDGERF
jgi:hypothetical protein